MDTITVAYGTHHLTSTDVTAEVQARLDGVTTDEISDNAALAIAASWQAPAGHGLTFARLVSHVPVSIAELLDAIHAEYPEARRQGVEAELDLLATWALHHPSRSQS